MLALDVCRVNESMMSHSVSLLSCQPFLGVLRMKPLRHEIICDKPSSSVVQRGLCSAWARLVEAPYPAQGSHKFMFYAQCQQAAPFCIRAGAAPRVAAACDDGVLRIFTAEGLEPGLSYAKSLPALGSRLLSVAWHPDGQSLITGTAAGTLHAWHLASGRELLRINVGARLRQPILRVPQPA